MYTQAIGDKERSQALSLHTENWILAVCSNLFWGHSFNLQKCSRLLIAPFYILLILFI